MTHPADVLTQVASDLDAVLSDNTLASLSDADRVRVLQAAGAVARRVEAVVLGREVREMDLTEKMAFFEAYGAIAGEAGVDPMRELLEPRGLLRRKAPPQVRACAALALGRIGTPEAVAALEAVAGDKDLIVRNAVNNALRSRAS